MFDTAGRLQLSAEDVGRHNAVDKLLGRLLMSGRLPLEDSLLFVSGRSSFEIVQKAYLGGLPLIAAVSAPSSLAIELAQPAGITLLGFVRGDRFNVYTHPDKGESECKHVGRALLHRSPAVTPARRSFSSSRYVWHSYSRS